MYLNNLLCFSDEPNDATVVTAANTNTRLFTDDANTNNAIAGGLLGNKSNNKLVFFSYCEIPKKKIGSNFVNCVRRSTNNDMLTHFFF